MTKDEALKLARDWIAERPADRPISAGKMISIIDRALAQPVRVLETAVYIRKDQLQKAAGAAMLCEVTPEPRQDRIRIYTTPPLPVQGPVGFAVMERPWVGLTDVDKCTVALAEAGYGCDWLDGYRNGLQHAEDKLKEKNSAV